MYKFYYFRNEILLGIYFLISFPWSANDVNFSAEHNFLLPAQTFIFDSAPVVCKFKNIVFIYYVAIPLYILTENVLHVMINENFYV